MVSLVERWFNMLGANYAMSFDGDAPVVSILYKTQPGSGTCKYDTRSCIDQNIGYCNKNV